MNIFRTYVKRNLMNNRLRTVMTIIGIMLSMALITAVIEGGYSGLEYIRDVFKGTFGNYHGYLYNLDAEALKDLESDDNVEAVELYRTLGWADINTTNSAKPYLLIKEISPDITNFLSINITEGRMPENDHELLISEHLDYNGNVDLKVGDTITLSVGKRALNTSKNDSSPLIIDGDQTAYQKDEYLLYTEENPEITYTICGLMPRLSYSIEYFECPGYTALTLAGNSGTFLSGSETSSAFFRLKDASVFNEFIGDFKASHPGVTADKNRELVALYGGITDRSYIMFIYGLIILLISLIVFGTIALIYNAFSISVGERTKQIGILKSVGATKKQIRKTIFYEAAFESGIAIPLGVALGCLGIGGTLYMLREGFSTFLGYYAGFTGAETTEIKLVIKVPLLIAAALLVMITTFISAIIPALRASGISPLDAVRQSKDIRTGNKIKKSVFLSKIFGIEGMLASKNYIRNRKRYRTTIVSLALSIILFIAASSFSAYMSVAAEDEFYTGNMSLVYYSSIFLDDSEESTQTQGSNSDLTEKLLLSAENVTKVIRLRELYSTNLISSDNIEYSIPLEELNPLEYSETAGGEYDVKADMDYINSNFASVVFMDEESFRSLAASESIHYDPDSAVPQAIVYNHGVVTTFDAEGNRKKSEYSFVEEDKIPADVTIGWNNSPYIENDKYLLLEVADKNGEVYLAYADDIGTDAFYNLLDKDYQMGNDVLESALNLYLYGQDDPAAAFPEGIPESTIEQLKNTSFLLKSQFQYQKNISVIGVTYNKDYMFSTTPVIILPYSAIDGFMEYGLSEEEFYIYSTKSSASEVDINRLFNENGMDTSGLINYDQSRENTRFMKKMINIFSFGFVFLISLVSIANVFNTISTNVGLRRREFGMLKSMGMSNRGITKMLNVECLIYGLRSILLGLPLAALVTFGVYKVTNRAFSTTFYIPWYSVVIAIAAVMIVVFVTMLYASRKIKKDNPIDALKNENI